MSFFLIIIAMMIILVLIILLMLTSSEIADYFFWYSDYNTPESDLVYNIVSNSRKKTCPTGDFCSATHGLLSNSVFQC